MNQFFKAIFFCATLMMTFNNSHALTILAFGDSLTQGYQRSVPGGQPYNCAGLGNGGRSSCGYVSELEADLNSNGQSSFVYNWGYAGERSTQGISRIGGVLNSRAADYILIWEGANDYLNGISSSTTRNMLKNMVGQAKAKNVRPILAYLSPNSNSSHNNSIKFDYIPKIRSLAAEEAIPDADIFSILGGSNLAVWDTYDSGDGLHINDSGYYRVADAWLASLNKDGFKKSVNTGGCYDGNGKFSCKNIVPFLQLLLLD